ncbi:MAG: hypothetical protein WCK55_21255, partial [Verrucomicrobiota bacterium]
RNPHMPAWRNGRRKGLKIHILALSSGCFTCLCQAGFTSENAHFCAELGFCEWRVENPSLLHKLLHKMRVHFHSGLDELGSQRRRIEDHWDAGCGGDANQDTKSLTHARFEDRANPTAVTDLRSRNRQSLLHRISLAADSCGEPRARRRLR